MRGLVWLLTGAALLGCGGHTDAPDEQQRTPDEPDAVGGPEQREPEALPTPDLGPCDMLPGEYELRLAREGTGVCALDPFVYECTPGEPLECPRAPAEGLPPIGFESTSVLATLAQYGTCETSAGGCGMSCVGMQLADNTNLLDLQLTRDSATAASGTTRLLTQQDLLPCEYALTLTRE